jgi:hypothetical protein
MIKVAVVQTNKQINLQSLLHASVRFEVGLTISHRLLTIFLSEVA